MMDGFEYIELLQRLTQRAIDQHARMMHRVVHGYTRDNRVVLPDLPASVKRFEFTVLQNPKNWSA